MALPSYQFSQEDVNSTVGRYLGMGYTPDQLRGFALSQGIAPEQFDLAINPAPVQAPVQAPYQPVQPQFEDAFYQPEPEPVYEPPAYTPPAYTAPVYTPPAYTEPVYTPPAYSQQDVTSTIGRYLDQGYTADQLRGLAESQGITPDQFSAAVSAYAPAPTPAPVSALEAAAPVVAPTGALPQAPAEVAAPQEPASPISQATATGGLDVTPSSENVYPEVVLPDGTSVVNNNNQGYIVTKPGQSLQTGTTIELYNPDGTLSGTRKQIQQGNLLVDELFDASGKSLGRSTMPIGQLGKEFAGTALSMLGPYGMAANALMQASQGNYLGALASAAGAGGGFAGGLGGELGGISQSTFQNVAAGANAANALKSGNWAGALSSIAGSGLGAQAAGTPIGETGFTLGDAVKGASALMALQNGQFGQAVTSLGQLADSQDAVVAGRALTLAQAVQSGNVGAIANAAQQLGSTMSDPGRISSLSGATPTTTVKTGAALDTSGASSDVTDLGISTYVNAINQLGATADDALAAANAAMNRATETLNTQNAIENASNFNDAFSQARAAYGPGKTFTWQGQEYSTSTRAEDPALAAASDAARQAAVGAGAGRGTAAGTTAAQAAELAKVPIRATEPTGGVLDVLNAAANVAGGGFAQLVARLTAQIPENANIFAGGDTALIDAIINSPEYKTLSPDQRQKIQDDIQGAVNDKMKNLSSLQKDIANGIGSGLQSAAAFAGTGGIGAIATLSSMAMNSAYNEGANTWLDDKGNSYDSKQAAIKAAGAENIRQLSDNENLLRATYMGAMEAIGEKLGLPYMKFFLKGMPITGNVGEMVNWLKNQGVKTGNEVISELATYGGQKLLDVFAPIGLDQNATAQSLYDGAISTIVSTVAGVGTQTGVGTARNVGTRIADVVTGDTSAAGDVTAPSVTTGAPAGTLGTGTGGISTLTGGTGDTTSVTGGDIFTGGLDTTGLTGLDTGSIINDYVTEVLRGGDGSSTVTSAVTSGADPAIVISSIFNTAASSGGNVSAAVNAAVKAASDVGANVTVSGNTVSSTQTKGDVTISTSVDNNTGVTKSTTVNNATGTTSEVVVDNTANVATKTDTDPNTGASTVTQTNLNTGATTLTTTDTASGTVTRVTTNPNTGTQTTVKTDAATETITTVDPSSGTETTIVVNNSTGSVISFDQGPAGPIQTIAPVTLPTVTAPAAEPAVAPEAAPAVTAPVEVPAVAPAAPIEAAPSVPAPAVAAEAVAPEVAAPVAPAPVAAEVAAPVVAPVAAPEVAAPEVVAPEVVAPAVAPAEVAPAEPAVTAPAAITPAVAAPAVEAPVVSPAAVTPVAEPVAPSVPAAEVAEAAAAPSTVQEQVTPVSEQTQQQLADQSAQTQAKFDSLNAAQQQQADALVQQGVDLTQAIELAQAQTQEAISNLDTRTQAQFNSLNQTQQNQAQQLVQQGQNLNNAIKQVSTELQQQIGNLDTKTQEQYNSLTQTQREQANLLIEQGQNLNTAIEQVSTLVQSQISDLSDETQDQYKKLTDTQKKEVEDRVKQGEDLKTAIVDSAAKTQAQFKEMARQNQAQAAARQAQGLMAQFPSAGAGALSSLAPQMLESKVTQGYIDPLAQAKRAQEQLERETMMQNIDPRLMQLLSQRMAPAGGLEAANTPHYTYGTEDSIEDILGGQASGFAKGGYVAPLMATGGMALPLLAKEGGLPTQKGGREDFKDGKHVAGEGDGQSDDIPAWLADGEFVFPADVVSALGNGSTKAGTDKLYEMMHSIRDRARSKGPKDLPPPALKSPLDYLKSKR